MMLKKLTLPRNNPTKKLIDIEMNYQKYLTLGTLLKVPKVIFFDNSFAQYNFTTEECFYFQNNKKTNLNTDLNLKQSTLQILLDKFAICIEKKPHSFDLDILKISLSSIKILEKFCPIK